MILTTHSATAEHKSSTLLCCCVSLMLEHHAPSASQISFRPPCWNTTAAGLRQITGWSSAAALQKRWGGVITTQWVFFWEDGTKAGTNTSNVIFSFLIHPLGDKNGVCDKLWATQKQITSMCHVYMCVFHCFLTSPMIYIDYMLLKSTLDVFHHLCVTLKPDFTETSCQWWFMLCYIYNHACMPEEPWGFFLAIK